MGIEITKETMGNSQKNYIVTSLNIQGFKKIQARKKRIFAVTTLVFSGRALWF